MAREKRLPTISDVAKLAQVSRATVSRAFGRPELIGEETVKRVLRAAKELGYQPNQTARALSTGRHTNIAIVVPDVANPFFPPLIRAAQAGADAAGYSVFLGDSDEDADREHTLTQRLALQVEGFILASSRMQDEQISELAERRPLVLVNRDTRGIPRVLIDAAAGIHAAVEHLAQLGHRRIVYVSGPSNSWSDQERRRALKRAVRKAGMESVAIGARRASFEAGRQVVAEVRGTGATAAITFDDLVAHGLLAGLLEHGVSVPREFSVIGCDDVLGASTFPALTSISARCDAAGQIAFDLLMKAMQGAESADVRCVLESRLAVRATTGAAPARSSRKA
ncbi:LacI family DNA-binding transcriptional regulator [Granulicella cerasi]|uniref:LacI family DNA-binding transcriptional regulator n=1 Tax=Granulicella cerasi TaxID=741063 RepID=A0ABW1ZA68_9BACT|nr:LacI family DNA-binding transcriptional regulator [Granulicella cerasi]